MEIYTVRGLCGLQPRKEAFGWIRRGWLTNKVLITTPSLQFPYAM